MYTYFNANEEHSYVFNICAPISKTAKVGKCLPPSNDEFTTFGIASQFWGNAPRDTYTCSLPVEPPATQANCEANGGAWVGTCTASLKSGPQCFADIAHGGGGGGGTTAAPTLAPTAWSAAACDACTAPCRVLGLAGMSATPLWAATNPDNPWAGINATFGGIVAPGDMYVPTGHRDAVLLSCC